MAMKCNIHILQTIQWHHEVDICFKTTHTHKHTFKEEFNQIKAIRHFFITLEMTHRHLSQKQGKKQNTMRVTTNNEQSLVNNKITTLEWTPTADISRRGAKNSDYKVSVFWYQIYIARLWERLLTSRGLSGDSTCVLKAWYQKTRTWYSIYQLTSWFTVQTNDCDYNRFLGRFNVIDDVIQKVHCHDDLIKAHAMR